MAVTIKGSDTESPRQPEALVAPVVEVKAAWSENWLVAPTLRALNVTRRSAGYDLSSATFLHRYGNVMQPWSTAFGNVSAAYLVNAWVRVRLASAEGLQTVFVGRIEGEGRTLFGDSPTDSGDQELVAYGPLRLLQKQTLATSFWYDAESVKECHHVPAFNLRDRWGSVLGNRSANKAGGTYCFHGTEGATWSRKDAAEYVLARFASATGISGLAFTLGGDTDLLGGSADVIPLAEFGTVAEALQQIIPRRLGMDFDVIPTDDGFEVHVFALLGKPVSFHGVTLPGNGRAFSMSREDHPEILSCRVIRSTEQQYSRIRVTGSRIVVCCTLRAANAGLPAGQSADLVPKWSSALEALYKAGDGTTTANPIGHDIARQDPVFAEVYCSFGAPDEWDFLVTEGQPGGSAAPVISVFGTGAVAETEDNLTAGPLVIACDSSFYQQSARATLPFIPLFDSMDYMEDVPVDHRPPGYQSSLRGPLVLLYDHMFGGYRESGAIGIGAAPADRDWGVRFYPYWRHMLALSHWAGAQASSVAPRFDHEDIIATIAFESDQRLYVEQAVPVSIDDGSVIEIPVPNAELWYLAPNTVVGLDDNGALKLSGDEPRILRSDVDRLAFVMAGAIVRYASWRSRAEIVASGHRPWSGMLGAILTAVQSGDDTFDLSGPITSVSWDFRGGTTTLCTGFA